MPCPFFPAGSSIYGKAAVSQRYRRRPALTGADSNSCRYTKNPNPLPTANRFGFLRFGGDKRDRTADLLNAIQALSPYKRVANPLKGGGKSAFGTQE